MGRKSCNLGYQMTTAITACTTEGESKREYKQKHGGDTGYKVFGLTYKNDLCETAKELGRFVHSNYPDVKLVREMTPEMVQTFLDTKKDCSMYTVQKVFSHLRKIDLIICHRYGAPGYSSKLTMPNVITDKQRDAVMTDQEFTELKRQLDGSGAQKSIILSRYAGLRVAETAKVKMERFTDRGGRWGYGVFEIQRGDGAKGNRPRRIDILTAEARKELRRITDGLRPGQYIVTKRDGTPYQSKSITRAIARRMDGYKQNRSHSLRKAFAQECYDVARRAGADKVEALAYTNIQLGHSGNRNDLSKAYVKVQW